MAVRCGEREKAGKIPGDGIVNEVCATTMLYRQFRRLP
jgi:hypothetical protein